MCLKKAKSSYIEYILFKLLKSQMLHKQGLMYGDTNNESCNNTFVFMAVKNMATGMLGR